MNKKDLIPVIILALLIPLWMFIDRTYIAKKFPAPAPVPAEQPAEQKPVAGNIEDAALTAAKPIAEQAVVVPAVIDTEIPADEIVKVLENENLRIELTSRGGGIKSATLFHYPELNEKESSPVVIDFSDSLPARSELEAGQTSLQVRRFGLPCPGKAHEKRLER